MSNFTYKSGDRIRYKVTPTLQGEGTVVGCSGISVMEVGATYMIKPDISCYSEENIFLNLCHV
jgi:hypothetical protein